MVWVQYRIHGRKDIQFAILQGSGSGLDQETVSRSSWGCKSKSVFVWDPVSRYDQYLRWICILIRILKAKWSWSEAHDNNVEWYRIVQSCGSGSGKIGFWQSSELFWRKSRFFYCFIYWGWNSDPVNLHTRIRNSCNNYWLIYRSAFDNDLIQIRVMWRARSGFGSSGWSNPDPQLQYANYWLIYREN